MVCAPRLVLVAQHPLALGTEDSALQHSGREKPISDKDHQWSFEPLSDRHGKHRKRTACYQTQPDVTNPPEQKPHDVLGGGDFQLWRISDSI